MSNVGFFASITLQAKWRIRQLEKVNNFERGELNNSLILNLNMY